MNELDQNDELPKDPKLNKDKIVSLDYVVVQINITILMIKR